MPFGYVCDCTPEPGDEKLLRYLWKNRHTTPFEMAGLRIEVQAPIMVFREWHRHRTQCLAGDVPVDFELPQRHRRGRHGPYRLTMEQLWNRWQPSTRKERPQRQKNAFFKRQRVAGMLLRCLDETTHEFTTTHIVDVIRSAPKQIFRATTLSGKVLRASAEHRVFTSAGWMTLQQAWETRADIACVSAAGPLIQYDRPALTETDLREEIWRSVPDWPEYEVSTLGRFRRIVMGQGVRSLGIARRGLVGNNGYPVMSLNRPGMQCLRTIHRLVLEAFSGPSGPNEEARHLNGNRLDSRLCNLRWGTVCENVADRLRHGTQQRLIPRYEPLVSYVEDGIEPTYDLSVAGPHNFVAGGIVVHNSYSELSARYTQMPDIHYTPTLDRVQLSSSTNKQAAAMGPLADAPELADWLRRGTEIQRHIYAHYEEGLCLGVPKEVARYNTPVSRYSRMQASANLLNWLRFLGLRMDANAQWEIRQFAIVVGDLVADYFPRTWAVYNAAPLDGRKSVA
jgi:thymidylate synthase (FAD)